MEGSTHLESSIETPEGLGPVPVNPISFPTPPREMVEAAIERSIGYLVRNCRESGKFFYLRHPDPVEDEKARYSKKYNILRHAGTIYSLTQAHEWAVNTRRKHLLPDLENTIVRAAGYLLQQVDDVPGLRGAKAVWSTADEEGNKACGRAAKLGGTGLGLLALVRAEAIRPGLASDDILQAMGRFILGMTLPHGAVIAKIDRHAQPLPVSSLYYPGEAALGLVTLARKIPNHQWTNTATGILSNLVRVGLLSKRYEADHWAVLAICSIGEFVDDTVRQYLGRHALAICRHIIGQQNPTDGSFRSDHAITPCAIRMEALLAFRNVLGPRARWFYEILTSSIDLGVNFLIRNQQLVGKFDGGFYKRWSDIDKNRSDKQIRIDYVQHSLSALLKYMIA